MHFCNETTVLVPLKSPEEEAKAWIMLGTSLLSLLCLSQWRQNAYSIKEKDSSQKKEPNDYCASSTSGLVIGGSVMENPVDKIAKILLSFADALTKMDCKEQGKVHENLLQIAFENSKKAVMQGSMDLLSVPSHDILLFFQSAV